MLLVRGAVCPVQLCTRIVPRRCTPVNHFVGNTTILLTIKTRRCTIAGEGGLVYHVEVKKVNSHFRVLVAQKELRDRRSYSIRSITEESGASRSAVERMLNNTIKNVPLDDLGLLCGWVPCEVGEMLRFEEVPDADR